MSLFDGEAAYSPTFTSFIVWLKKVKQLDTTERTIYNSVTKYFPNIKKDMEQIRADTLINGALLGKYASTPTIFALKNWCGWRDKNEPDEGSMQSAGVVILPEVKAAESDGV